ncbi:hypothetical protein BH09PAT1_BH09PAT1_8810 [soil metagenome]
MDYRDILDAIPQLIFVTKADGITGVFYNSAWYQYTGLSEEDTASGLGAIIDPYDTERVSSIIKNAVSNGEPYEVEVRIRHDHTGAFKWFLSKANPVKDSSGNITNYVGISTDIDIIKKSVRDMETVYEHAMAERIEKIKRLEDELKIHKSVI